MHALVVGGTGMLRPVVHYLLENGWQVSVIARTDHSLAVLKNEVGSMADKLHSIAVDYANDEVLKSNVNQAITNQGAITLTVAWIHSSSPQALVTIAHIVKGDLFQVRSAGVSRETYQDPFDLKAVQKIADLNYYRIILGFQLEGNYARWLTNSEIAAGVINAIEQKNPSQVIGVVEPWDQHP